MRKKTAVEYLVKEFSDMIGKINLSGMQELLLMDAITKAKALEKQQIEDAYEQGDIQLVNSEQYYTQTYKD